MQPLLFAQIIALRNKKILHERLVQKIIQEFDAKIKRNSEQFRRTNKNEKKVLELHEFH